MGCAPRPDDFDARREHLRALTDEELRARFWQLAEEVVAPLVEEARTHTTPSIERSVLLRMGCSSMEASAAVRRLAAAGLLGHGAGQIVLEAARRHGVAVRDAAVALGEGRWLEELTP